VKPQGQGHRNFEYKFCLPTFVMDAVAKAILKMKIVSNSLIGE
jgi:hypothetical protein